ncbi:glutathione-S-transferas-like protein omega 1 [Boeremia exigua]|uniref:glutathione-S-transferase-like protein omega 1 n=1 Tax=Boeremia exigua TaxID=749465 RepID=UPI001E8CEC1A|nr:glutathione-S-transferase-like protein omega 1 [Boeremia exigua]KAH6633203.1 glutathione-S-transferas-like protein omega 1 [Boeremia exigua]
MGSTGDKITLYTNHRCPWAHRAHIVFKELGLQYEEVIIDLDTPREPWYLEINPRGLVPAIKFNDQIITESGVVARFLADAYPSHLVPNTGNVDAALTRARINFFVDTWFDKVGSYWFQILRAEDEAKKDELVKEFLDKVTKEIEPLLQDAAPFFGGSSKVTLAEALTAPFVLRIHSFSKHELLPKSVHEGLDALPNFKKWAQAVITQESVTYIWNEEEVISSTKKRIEGLKSAAK